MHLKYKTQDFQTAAVDAVCDVFKGPVQYQNSRLQYVTEIETEEKEVRLLPNSCLANAPFNLFLTQQQLLANIQAVQGRSSGYLEKSTQLLGNGLNLTVQMETGVGKTYTYIKTIYELNKRYGWAKFIIVVPSIAIREGVLQSFKDTAKHFRHTYTEQAHYFVYDSDNLGDIQSFADSSRIQVMIINSQAFNAKTAVRRINMEMDAMNGMKPINLIAGTAPIVIIDEPQSVEGKNTKETLKKFKALFTLRYSATPKKGEEYNIVYRLDALDALNQRLVKKIFIKSVEESIVPGTTHYVRLCKFILSKDEAPKVRFEIDYKSKSGIKRKVITATKGTNLFDESGGLTEYKDNFIVDSINADKRVVTFRNGREVSNVIGLLNEEMLRRIQIRETIASHLEKERELYDSKIKVLSLFFIDAVANYRMYTSEGPQPGVFAKMFEEEYTAAVGKILTQRGISPEYKSYLKESLKHISDIHGGYFSQDKKTGKLIDSDVKPGKFSMDTDAYDLIMRDKPRLLSMKEPLRFIFSHSALREGWDNPNVFQICALKDSNVNSGEIRRKQEVGRGLRLCVNDSGVRMDTSELGEEDVHRVNTLTVISNESYSQFCKAISEEHEDCLNGRPKVLKAEMLVDREYSEGDSVKRITYADAAKIISELYNGGYLNKNAELTQEGERHIDDFRLSDELSCKRTAITSVLSEMNSKNLVRKIVNQSNRTKKLPEKVGDVKRKEMFSELWANLSYKSIYTFTVASENLIDEAAKDINAMLSVTRPTYKVRSGHISENMDGANGNVLFQDTGEDTVEAGNIRHALKYDLIGRLAESTHLTRKSIIKILEKAGNKLDCYAVNPEEFISRATELISSKLVDFKITQIDYKILPESFSDDVFSYPLSTNNTTRSKKAYPYQDLVLDSNVEEHFAHDADCDKRVKLLVKLPKKFYIQTPAGRYTPDWAIVATSSKGDIHEVCFIVETKGHGGSMESLRPTEQRKIEYAKRHFKALNTYVQQNKENSKYTEFTYGKPVEKLKQLLDAYKNL